MRYGDGTHRTNELSRVFLNTTLSPFTLVNFFESFWYREFRTLDITLSKFEESV